MRFALTSAVTVFAACYFSVPAFAQDASAEIKARYPNGVYTSTRVHQIPRARCVPCKNNEGDDIPLQEAIPYRMDPKTARFVCRPDPKDNKSDDNPCVFNTNTKVNIDNVGMIAATTYRSRSNAVLIHLEADILDDQSKME